MPFAASTVVQIRCPFGIVAVYRAPCAAGIVSWRVVVIVVVACTQGQFAAFYRTEQSAAGTHVADISAERGRIPFQSAAHGDDVQYAAHSFGVIFWTGVSDYFDVFDGIGRHAFQHFRGVVAHHIVGLSVHVNLEAAAAVHLYVVFAVHGHHRYLAKHLQHGVRLRIGVVLHVVLYLVDVRFH